MLFNLLFDIRAEIKEGEREKAPLVSLRFLLVTDDIPAYGLSFMAWCLIKHKDNRTLYTIRIASPSSLPNLSVELLCTVLMSLHRFPCRYYLWDGQVSVSKCSCYTLSEVRPVAPVRLCLHVPNRI
jgi:hypothetical protein